MANNLLDKASIILTPTAYDNGKALCVKPSDGSGDFDFSRNSAATRVNAQGLVENVQILSSNLVQNGDFSEEGSEEVSNGSFSQEGSELVTGGDFSNPSDWILQANASIGNNELTLNGSSNTVYALQNLYSSGLYNGKTLRFTYEIISNTLVGGGNFRGGGITGGSLFPSANLELNSTVGIHTVDIVINSTGVNSALDIFITSPYTSGSLVIDNLSVREVAQDWSLGTGWSIGTDKAVANTTGDFVNLYQNSVFVVGKTYKTTFTIVDYTQGKVRLTESGYDVSGYQNAVGTYTTYFTATQTDLYMQGSESFNGSITNISVKEVAQNWDFDANWSIGNNKAISTGAGRMFQSIPFLETNVGTKVKVSFDIVDYTSAGVVINCYGGVSSLFQGVGSYSFITTTTNTLNLYVNNSGAGNLVGSITNLSVIAITEDTNLPRINYEGFSYQDVLGSELVVNGDFATDSDWGMQSNWTIANGSANSNGSGLIYQTSVSYIDGKTYKVTFDADITSGSGTVRLGNTTAATAFVNGSNEFYLQTDASNTTRYIFFNGNSLVGSIDNVSVKEYLGQEVVPESGCGSWLFEPQSTNLLLNSDNGSSYGVYSATKTLDEVISLDGTLNSFTLEGNGDTNQVLGYTANKTLSAGDYTFSVFAKKGTNDFIQLFFDGFSGSLNGAAYFDLENGTTPSSFGKIESYGNGWFRCSVVGTVVSGDLNGRFGFRISYTSSNFFFPTANDAIGKNAYFYGFQTEQKSYATSYIPTEGSSVTRNQDVCNNGGSLASINSTEGTLYFEGSYPKTTSGSGNKRIAISDGTSSNRVMFAEIGNTGLSALITSQGINSAYITGSLDNLSNFKAAISYKQNDFALWINGLKVATDTSGNVPIGLNEIAFDGGDGTNDFFGKTKALAVWPEALSDQELADLTYPTPTFPTFTLDFNTIAEQFTFTRGSEATYVDAQGLIQSTASNNTPRLDYSTGAEAFLLEPQSTNLVTYSSDFSNVAWAKNGALIATANASTSPSGETDATLLYNTGNENRISQNISVVSGNSYTMSVYLRNNGGNNTITFEAIGYSSQSITINNDWARYDYTITATSTANVQFRFLSFDNNINLYAWGAQLEQKSYATSYIPSEGSQTTRNQETCINATPEINSEEGVLYAEISALANDGTNRIITISDGSYQNSARIQFYVNTNEVEMRMVVGGAVQALQRVAIASVLDYNKIAFVYSVNDFALWINGSKLRFDTSGSVPIANTFNVVNFDDGGGSAKFFGNTKDLQVYTKALSDAELIKLTTI